MIHPWGLRIAAAILLGLIALHAPSATWAAPLSLDDALRLAQERSRQLSAQDASAAAAREMAIAAGQRPDPTLKAGINNLPINGEERFSLSRDFMTMRSVGVMQELTRSSKLKARSARYERDAEVAEAGHTLALANLQRDTAVAWLDRFYQERMRDVLVRQRDEARLQIEAADAGYRGGRGSQADVFAARSAVAQIDDRIAQVDRQVTTARTQLGRWVGAPAAEPLGSAPALDVVRLRAEDLEAQIAHHPQIAVLLKQEAAAQADVEVARANKHSDWSVEVMLSQRGPAYSNMVSVGVSVPLQWDQTNRQDREVAAKLAMVEQVRAQREEETRMHVADALAMLLEWQSNRERLQRYDASLLPLAGERTHAAVAAYRGGTGPLNVVLEARRAEIDTRMERLRLEMETARLWAQLNYLVPAGHGRPQNSKENPQ
ncbi:TolC family protein [Ideonella sp. YS5]|uniref:TolC family protein n=1 Tax=Ideonella sp. YS5 TaxID=3453714 RepID=UPI003EEB9C95